MAAQPVVVVDGGCGACMNETLSSVVRVCACECGSWPSACGGGGGARDFGCCACSLPQHHGRRLRAPRAAHRHGRRTRCFAPPGHTRRDSVMSHRTAAVTANRAGRATPPRAAQHQCDGARSMGIRRDVQHRCALVARRAPRRAPSNDSHYKHMESWLRRRAAHAHAHAWCGGGQLAAAPVCVGGVAVMRAAAWLIVRRGATVA